MKLVDCVELYVERKQRSGLSYKTQKETFQAFCRFLGRIDVDAITGDDVLSFLDARPISVAIWRQRYSLLAGLFDYWSLLGEIHSFQMPAPRARTRMRLAPYVYSSEEVRALVDSASQTEKYSRSLIPSETFRTMLLFLYATGSRLSEATALKSEDIDLPHRRVRLHANGFGVVREIPIGMDLKRVLIAYVRWKRSMQVQGNSFFLLRDGRKVTREASYTLFRRVLAQAGVNRNPRGLSKPRIYDLRGTFAVHQITKWIRLKMNIGNLLPALSAYLGQKDLNAAERYLAMTPTRFERELTTLSPKRGKAWSSEPEVMNFLSRL